MTQKNEPAVLLPIDEEDTVSLYPRSYLYYAPSTHDDEDDYPCYGYVQSKPVPATQEDDHWVSSLTNITMEQTQEEEKPTREQAKTLMTSLSGKYVRGQGKDDTPMCDTDTCKHDWKLVGMGMYHCPLCKQNVVDH